ncbi:uncharacterized protein LOC130647998 [Hydractinia symbiolongicarpus]|uniref:uncharacterized protein LOC130647998 n=1 Tax=Hydractinia symbiolongicarpus TaxID=13093 RepID=UPI00254BDBFB|nr:uncharacterized protein LOC130647998 [Hydractinia symbiolongicarpus]
MSAKRYIDLRRYLHVVDNTTKEQPENKNDKLFKIRPVLEAIQENCFKIEPEPVQSIDEQIIPAKTSEVGYGNIIQKNEKNGVLKCLFVQDNLKEYGILTCATMRANRLANPLSSEKELQKSGRGSKSHKVDKNSGIMLMRWFDNKSVQLASTYCSFKQSGTVRRWDAKSKSHIQVPCPEIVREYNSAMGGLTWLIC